MGLKLLFLLGIVAAHGAVAAGFSTQDGSARRTPSRTCVRTPAPAPHFEQPRELLAYAVRPDDPDSPARHP
jgi:hypothetical protein